MSYPLPKPLSRSGNALPSRLIEAELALDGVIRYLESRKDDEHSNVKNEAFQTLKSQLESHISHSNQQQDSILLEMRRLLDVPPPQFPDLSGFDRNFRELKDTLVQQAKALSETEAKIASLTEQLEGMVQKYAELHAFLDMGELSTASDITTTSDINAGLSELSSSTDDLPADLAGREALLEDGRFTTTKALMEATDEELDSVKGIGAATVKSIRSTLNQAEKPKEAADE